MERDCAICLSTLHAPSPPEPAKLVNEAIAADGADDAVKAGSMSNASLSEQEVILRLKVCGHEFHAECLTSWFSIRKHSCPICRAIYYTKTEEVVPDEQQQQPETQTIPAQESPSVPNGQRREEV
ncbi:hypothetical protein BDV95DRAFT_556606 [Massariosphaeria phaeospora]|uniref:RING-type domain-containing protein n=1 Tax=Massariosphaeria phaeospora TaxID=100035 RepID=A0A7C8MP20_9PLEO|nr:hypothetical protein BDV95DRAFT_556606 [Massariosphaeria phaeospora]